MKPVHDAYLADLKKLGGDLRRAAEIARARKKDERVRQAFRNANAKMVLQST